MSAKVTPNAAVDDTPNAAARAVDDARRIDGAGPYAPRATDAFVTERAQLASRLVDMWSPAGVPATPWPPLQPARVDDGALALPSWATTAHSRMPPLALYVEKDGRVGIEKKAVEAARLSPATAALVTQALASQFADTVLREMFSGKPASTAERESLAYLLTQLLQLRALLRRHGGQAAQQQKIIACLHRIKVDAFVPMPSRPPHNFLALAVAHCDTDALALLAPKGALMQSMVRSLELGQREDPEIMHALYCSQTNEWKAAGRAAQQAMLRRLGQDSAVCLRGRHLAVQMLCIGSIVSNLAFRQNADALTYFLTPLRDEPNYPDLAAAALHWAVSFRWLAGVRALLTGQGVSGAVRQPPADLDLPKGSSPTVLQYVADPKRCEDDNSIEMARLLLQHGARPQTLGYLGEINKTVNGFWTPVSAHTQACLYGYAKLARLYGDHERARSAETLPVAMAEAMLANAKHALALFETHDCVAATEQLLIAHEQARLLHLDGGTLHRSASGQRLVASMYSLTSAVIPSLMKTAANVTDPVAHSMEMICAFMNGHPLFLRGIIEDFIDVLEQWSEPGGLADAKLAKTKKQAGSAANAPASAWLEAVAASKARDSLVLSQLLQSLPPISFFVWGGHTAGLRLYFQTTSALCLADLGTAWFIALQAQGRAAGQASFSEAEKYDDDVVLQLMQAAQSDAELFILLETAIVAQSAWGVDNVVGQMVSRGKKRKLEIPQKILRALLGAALPMGKTTLSRILEVLPKGEPLRSVIALRDEGGDTLLHVAGRYSGGVADVVSALLQKDDRVFHIRNMEGKTAAEESHGHAADDVAFAEGEATSLFFVNAAKARARRPDVRTDARESRSAPLTWTQQVDRAPSAAAREQVVNAFLRGLTKQTVGSQRAHVDGEEAGRLVAALHRASRLQGMGAHFLAHRPQVARAALVERLRDPDLARETASAFGANDATELLRLRCRALTLAERDIAADDFLRHTLDLESPHLSGRAVHIAEDGTTTFDAENIRAVRFVLQRQRSRSGMLLISCYPISMEARRHRPMEMVRRVPQSAAA